jgi:hypothetical protein
MTARTPPRACVNCGQLIDAATSPTAPKARPKAGDISVCFYCRHVQIFNSDLTLRELTDQEMHEIAGHPDVVRINKIPKAKP